MIGLLLCLISEGDVIKLFFFLNSNFFSEIRDEQLVVVLEKGGDDLSAILKQLATKQNHLPNHMLLFYWMEMLYSVQQIHKNGT